MKNSQTNPSIFRSDAVSSDGAFRTPHSALRIPELLAPAGDWECARAAVENGADAIYFGLDKFNARMRARNFTAAELPKLMEFLHRRGVKGYVTFNTLVFANELAEAEHHLRAIIAAGADAAIVQDIGICRLIRRLSPDFPIHASTQMTITSAGGVDFVRELGCQLVVLARECSIREITSISREPRVEGREPEPAVRNQPSTLDARPSTLPLEVFVHGALCVAYSGQCLTSEALGGRSANRGECAQACRMPYELISDGQLVPLGDRRYLLSPQDLAGIELLPELIHAGVASLKIEGRLKSPEYVANITRIYRQALDSWVEGRGSRVEGRTSAESGGSRLSTLDPRPSTYEMEMAFSRGLFTGWFRGINNQQLVHARFGKKRGVYLGDVSRVQREAVFVRLHGPLKPGDGVVFDAGHPEEKEEGGRVYEVRRQKAEGRIQTEALLTFGRGDINFRRVHVGDKMWKTSDPELDRRLRQTFAGDRPRFQRPIQIEVHGHTGAPLTIIARDETGQVAQVESSVPLAKAKTQPLITERLRKQLGRLGGTPFRLDTLKNYLEGEVMLGLSDLNRLRRDLVSRLEILRAQPKRWTLRSFEFQVSCFKLDESQRDLPNKRSVEPGHPELIVLVRSLPQLEAALRCGARTIYCEFEDPKKYRDAVGTFRATPSTLPPSASASAESRRSTAETDNLQPSTIWVAPPRIFKTGEEWTLKQVRSSDADGYLIRNYDHLEWFADCRRRGDFSLNVANPIAAEYFINRYGLERVTASYDLNIVQLEALLRSAPPEWFEITIHQHLPMFHMEHCVFCAFLSRGTDYTNCGRPCDQHDVKLRDRVGAEHPLKADVGCRNTLFNALAQTGAEYVDRLRALGASRFRIEFVNETPAQVEQTIAKYLQLLRGEITGPQLWRELKLRHQLGVTRGPMEERTRS